MKNKMAGKTKGIASILSMPTITNLPMAVDIYPIKPLFLALFCRDAFDNSTSQVYHIAFTSASPHQHA